MNVYWAPSTIGQSFAAAGAPVAPGAAADASAGLGSGLSSELSIAQAACIPMAQISHTSGWRSQARTYLLNCIAYFFPGSARKFAGWIRATKKQLASGDRTEDL